MMANEAIFFILCHIKGKLYELKGMCKESSIKASVEVEKERSEQNSWLKIS